MPTCRTSPSAFGYTNASWTLKCDLTCEYVCRLLNYMDRRGYKQCMPHNGDPDHHRMPWLNFSSGYVQRALAKMPKQGRSGRGGCTRTTRSTSSRCASARSTTA